MSTPGYGARARVISPTSGKEWFGEVLVWGPAGAVFLRDAETAETRWFPASWVKATIEGPPDFDRGECPCAVHIEVDAESGAASETYEVDPACPHHGDPETVASNILKAARK
jgi:hypothetical protein